jgi:crotonobetaine/carnitine-CoA ligase
MEVCLLDSNDQPVAPGAVGEICVRGKRSFTLFSGYFNRSEDTVKSFRNQWHHTGDLGRVDGDGELFFVDRQRDSTRHKGRNVSSFEVEHIARQYPGVALVAAVGTQCRTLQGKTSS